MSAASSTAQPRRAVVLLSGGLDSATVLAIARARGFECYALSVHYGQRHSAELAAARLIASSLGAREHRIMGVDLAGIGGGVNAVDYSGYPDCRPEFIAAFENLARLATKAGVEGVPFKIQAPLIEMSKADIIRTGAELGVDFAMTVSCYQAGPDGAACGKCDSCRLRAAGFAAARIPDSTRYAV